MKEITVEIETLIGTIAIAEDASFEYLNSKIFECFFNTVKGIDSPEKGNKITVKINKIVDRVEFIGSKK